MAEKRAPDQTVQRLSKTIAGKIFDNWRVYIADLLKDLATKDQRALTDQLKGLATNI
jgi:hypothetical protein